MPTRYLVFRTACPGAVPTITDNLATQEAAVAVVTERNAKSLSDGLPVLWEWEARKGKLGRHARQRQKRRERAMLAAGNL